MQYIKKNQGSYNLHMVRTKKFKTITLKIIFHTPIVKEDITKRNVLSDILLQSTSKYSSKRNMIIEAENLYAVDVYNNTQRLGNYIMTSFILQVLNDRYTEEGNVEKAFEFLNEILFHPDVCNNSFREDKLSLVKNNCRVALSELKEDTHDYCMIRLKEAYDKNSPVSYRMIGYVEDLEKIDEHNLYQYYLNMIDSDYVDIFVVGDFNPKDMLEMVKKNFHFRKVKKEKMKYELDNKTVRKRRLIAKEKEENNQSKLGILCPLSKMKDYEKNYPMVLANIILGGGVDSKLFKTVREKYSYCYSIFSSYYKLDQMIVISAGIDKENYSKTLKEITDVLNQLKKGKFQDKDIKIAKELYNNSINSIEESPMNLISEYLSEEIVGFETYKEREKIMNKVSKKEIIHAFKKIKIDTVFLLEGDKNEEN